MDVIGAPHKVTEHGVLVQLGAFELLLPTFWSKVRVETHDNAGFAKAVIGPGLSFTFSYFNGRMDIAQILDSSPDLVVERATDALTIQDCCFEGRHARFGDVGALRAGAPPGYNFEDMAFERYAGIVDEWTVEFGFSTDAAARSVASHDQIRPMILGVVEIGIIHARRAAARG